MSFLLQPSKTKLTIENKYSVRKRKITVQHHLLDDILKAHHCNKPLKCKPLLLRLYSAHCGSSFFTKHCHVSFKFLHFCFSSMQFCHVLWNRSFPDSCLSSRNLCSLFTLQGHSKLCFKGLVSTGKRARY